jgi:Fur family transcriptional regulator, peroxide stress response regulator
LRGPNLTISTAFLTKELTRKGIRVSYHRIKVLECLYVKDAHPTVDEIFRSLSNEIPSLSKATIYNALHTFVQAGMARVITIDDNETRYDITTTNHGHFKCESCGRIVNFEIDIDRMAIEGLDRFQIREKSVYFNGLCPDCSNHPEEKKEI